MRNELAVALMLLAACAEGEADPVASPEAGAWVSLFDGETLEGWTPKIAGYPLGENFGETFRVEDGVIKARFDQYGDDFAGRYGNLIYETPYRHYRLRLEYRFTGEQAPGAEGWAELNSGVLYHMQPPATIPNEAAFPVSLEAQFLAEGAHAPTTGNMCSIETHVVIDGEDRHEHCIGGPVPARPRDQWVRFELIAAPDGSFTHLIDGEEAFAFERAAYDEAHPWADGLAVTNGYFALQSESHPVEFRNIELMVLED